MKMGVREMNRRSFFGTIAAAVAASKVSAPAKADAPTLLPTVHAGSYPTTGQRVYRVEEMVPMHDAIRVGHFVKLVRGQVAIAGPGDTPYGVVVGVRIDRSRVMVQTTGHVLLQTNLGS